MHTIHECSIHNICIQTSMGNTNWTHYTGCAMCCHFIIECIDKAHRIGTRREFLTREEIPVVYAMKALHPTMRSMIRMAMHQRLDHERECIARVVCPVCDAPMEQGYECDSPYTRCIEVWRDNYAGLHSTGHVG